MNGDKDVVPAIASIPLDRVVCVYGQEEDDTACTADELKGMDTIKLPGGHHFDENYEPIAAALLDKMRSRAGFAAAPCALRQITCRYRFRGKWDMNVRL